MPGILDPAVNDRSTVGDPDDPAARDDALWIVDEGFYDRDERVKLALEKTDAVRVPSS